MRSFHYERLSDARWDSEIVMLVAQIHEHKGRQELYLRQKPAVLQKLIDIAKVQSTEASNKIEGIITTSTRLRALCEEKTTPQNRDEEEILGYRDVLNTIHESYEYIPLSTNVILQLHRDLYRYSEKSIGGSFKHTQNVISETRPDGSVIERFVPLSPFETPGAMDAICESFCRTLDASLVDTLILIPVFIHDFLCIHPFHDGNGRMSRLLTTLLLYRAGFVVGRYISIERKIEQTKAQYYDVLQKSGLAWHEGENDETAFIKYMLRMILAAYRDFEARVSLTEEKLPAPALVRRATREKLGKFTKSDILELVPQVGKASIEHALKTLCEEGYLERHGKGKATFYVRVGNDEGGF